MRHPVNGWAQQMISLADASGWMVVELVTAMEGHRDLHTIRIALEDGRGNRLVLSGNAGLEFEEYLEHLTPVKRKLEIGGT
jgi:hypothetical protein